MEWVGFDPRCPAAKWMCKAGTLTWFPLLRQARGVRTGEVQFCGPRACVPKDIPGGRERLGGAWGQVEEQPLCGHTGGSVRMVSTPAHIRGADPRRLGLTPRVTDPTPAFLVLRAPHPGQASPSSCWRPASGWGPGAEPGPPAGARAGLRPTSCQVPKQGGEIGSHPLGRHAGAHGTVPSLSCPTGVLAAC